MGDVRYSMCAIQYLSCGRLWWGLLCLYCCVPPPPSCSSAAHLPRPRCCCREQCSDSSLCQWETGRRLLTVLKGAWHDFFFSFYATQRGPNEQAQYLHVRAEGGDHMCCHEYVSLRSMCHVFVCVCVWVIEQPVAAPKIQTGEWAELHLSCWWWWT